MQMWPIRSYGAHRRRPRPAVKVAMALTGVSLLLAAAFVLAASVTVGTASAYPYSDVDLVGHGWGNAYGMGQWGAFGYSMDGLTYSEILQHYYGSVAGGGSTTLGQLSSTQDETKISVDIQEVDGEDTVVTSDSPFTVAGHGFAARSVAIMAPANSADTSWNVYEGTGGACSDSHGPTPVASDVADPEAIPSVSAPWPANENLAKQVLELCIDGAPEAMRGDIEATTYDEDGPRELRTVDILPLEFYISDVVPSESPTYWGELGAVRAQGQPEGFQELEAQAVAARSYVMSDLGGFGGYADTCDEECQSYPGIKNESLIADQAVIDTKGQVLYMPSGAVAQTQYSSSTGGWTLASTFAAVPDAGDAVCVPGVAGACNPHHTWTASVPVSAIESTFPSIGAFESLDVTQRNGIGDFGGRVLELAVVGSSGSVDTTGWDFASDFYSYGVQSEWFASAGQSSGGVGGYWLAASDGGIFSFGNAQFYGSMGGRPLNAPVVGMAATADHHGYWLVASDGGIFSFGDAKFYGSTGDKVLNRPIEGMARDAEGTGYWMVAQDGGIFAFGSARYQGSLPGIGIDEDTARGLLPTSDGGGYLIYCGDGTAYELGDAPQFGDVASAVSGYDGDVVGGASVPS